MFLLVCVGGFKNDSERWSWMVWHVIRSNVYDASDENVRTRTEVEVGKS